MCTINQASDNGLNLIKGFEGFRSNPYLDVAGVPTIGYGATYYPGGQKVTMNDAPITEEQATEMLKSMLTDFEQAVSTTIIPEINQNQFDALTSFTYNVGTGALKHSTVARLINENPADPHITDAFLMWVKAGGKVNEDLVYRRTKEARLYFTPITTENTNDTI